MSDAVRRIGGTLGGAGEGQKTTSLLEDMKATLRSIDDKTLWPTSNGAAEGRWPA
jgi:hypothetical protein